MNYCDFLFNVRPEWQDNLALVDADSGKRYTYRQLQAAVLAFANYLHARGLQPGVVVTTHLYNSAAAVIAHLSVQYIGCVTCLLDPLLPVQGLPYYLNDTGTQCLITHLSQDVASPVLPHGVQWIHSMQVDQVSAQDGPYLSSPAYDFDPDALGAIFYTSGTTSQPKGVMLATKNFFAHFKVFTRSCYTYTPHDRLLCFVPFSHGYGSKSIFLPCLYSGAALVMLRAFQPMKVVEVVARERITHLFGVPAHYQQLLRRPEWVESLKSLRAAFSAAALLSLETAQQWKDQVGIYLDEGYGLIETCTGVAFRRNRLPDRLGHIGSYPADLVEIEIVDEAFNFLPANDRGEIVVRGENVMKGYLNKPEETARVLQNGWFRTGDMGYKTLQNEIIMTGRIKDVINIAGIKVAPFEIEAALNEHPAVAESAVVGVDDALYGEAVRAFVKIKPGTSVEERELIRFLQKRLMNFQVPKSIVFVNEFPRNNMGKVDKKALRADITQAQAEQAMS